MPEEVVVDTGKLVLPSFYDFWRACRNSAYTFLVCKGGRDSAKSTHIAIRLVFDLMDLPINIMCMRKVGNTIEKSIYEQIKKAIFLMGLESEFVFLKSPMTIKYKARGNYFFFMGGDNTDKTKSIVTSEFPITKLWIEEVSEFKTEEELETVINSILRETLPDGMTYQIFFSYNPPKRKQHWLNKKFETQFLPENTFVHHSYYYNNNFLSAQALEVIENTRLTNVHKYNWMYLGSPTGGGIVPFDNLTFRKITDEEIKSFDNYRQGLDWGYATDPLAFVRLHYDKTRRKIYFTNEIYGVKISNREIAQGILRNGFHKTLTLADSAEPKSIAEVKEFGVRIQGAKKGKDSVEYGEKWLDDLDEIIIDPKRTPNVAREFEGIDYMVDRDGNQMPRLVDKDNHSIDSTRYSLSDDMKRSSIRFFKT